MTCYVDDVRHQFGREIICHMWADALEELLAMADRIGIARRWLKQPPKASWLHFAISLEMKYEAIRAGCVITDIYGPMEHTARLHIASGDPDLVICGEQKLAQLDDVRRLLGWKRKNGDD